MSDVTSTTETPSATGDGLPSRRAAPPRARRDRQRADQRRREVEGERERRVGAASVHGCRVKVEERRGDEEPARKGAGRGCESDATRPLAVERPRGRAPQSKIPSTATDCASPSAPAPSPNW